CRFVGRGGWGEVWKAEMPSGRTLALKFLPCDSTLAASQEVRSLQAIRQLRHPHLLAIDQVWCWQGYIVMAMDLAEGSLQDLLGVAQADLGLPLSPDPACDFLAQAASALDFLNTRQHTRGGQRVAIRHCDVKPSNMLLFGDTLKVADFSLATPTTSPLWYNR